MAHELLTKDPLLNEEPGLSIMVILVLSLCVSIVANVLMAVRCREYIRAIDSVCSSERMP